MGMIALLWAFSSEIYAMRFATKIGATFLRDGTEVLMSSFKAFAFLL